MTAPLPMMAQVVVEVTDFDGNLARFTYLAEHPDRNPLRDPSAGLIVELTTTSTRPDRDASIRHDCALSIRGAATYTLEIRPAPHPDEIPAAVQGETLGMVPGQG